MTTEMHANGPNKIYYIRDYVDEVVSSKIFQMRRFPPSPAHLIKIQLRLIVLLSSDWRQKTMSVDRQIEK